jgi:iron complex transport system ATP-binding protein
MTAAIQVNQVSFNYGPQKPVLSRIDFAVESGTFLAVAGPNGAGKSTLVQIIAGILKPGAGRVLLDGQDLSSYGVRELARHIALVRQEFVPAFGFSVIETVLMARTPHYGAWGFESREDRDLVMKALERTDTARFASRALGSLSSGERQRVFLARALAQNTPILLLDEPTSFLDLKYQVGIYDLLKSIQADMGVTILAVTHDINLASQYCDEALLLCPLTEGPDARPDRPGPHDHPQFRIGRTSEIFAPEEIQQAFGIRVFAGRVGAERFILPLGTRAKDAHLPTLPT